MARRKTHADVEYMVEDSTGHAVHLQDFHAAVVEAFNWATATGAKVTLDVLIWTAKGARFYGGDDAVKQFREDPEASVFERFEISVNSAGRIP